MWASCSLPIKIILSKATQQEHTEGRGGLLSFSPYACPQVFFLRPKKLAPATQASPRGRRESTRAQIPPSPSPFDVCHAGYMQASCSDGLLHSARTKIQLSAVSPWPVLFSWQQGEATLFHQGWDIRYANVGAWKCLFLAAMEELVTRKRLLEKSQLWPCRQSMHSALVCVYSL